MPKIPNVGMLRMNTPFERYSEYNLWVKREDLSCPPPGPPFSKTRGVFAHLQSRPEQIIGVLDTFHSQAGHAVARACQILGKECVNFYPVYKNNRGMQPPQIASEALGAQLRPLQAGRSCILYHAARKQTVALGGYMMPNALKLSESVTETAKEVANLPSGIDQVILPCSSGTIAAGVIRGFEEAKIHPTYLLHLGYSRSVEALERYLIESSGLTSNLNNLKGRFTFIDEGYNYKDVARPGETPPWPCNVYYDLKAFRWWNRHGIGEALLWNIG